MGRTPRCDKNGLKKGTWTPEEDRKLVAYVTRYGCWNWRQLPRFAGLSRCGKSCRLRWMNYLRPNIKRGNYTKEEEDTIISLHEKLGNRWSTIAAQLPGRTDNEIKNHWHTTLKKRIEQKNLSLSSAHKFTNLPKDEQISCEDHGESKPNATIKEEQETKALMINSTSTSSLILESSSTNSSMTAETSAGKSAENHEEVFFQPNVELSGNFWTEPFLPDNSPLVNPEYVHFPFLLDEEILC